MGEFLFGIGYERVNDRRHCSLDGYMDGYEYSRFSWTYRLPFLDPMTKNTMRFACKLERNQI